ncbi:hypothetical protein [Blattabacterium cuenoti]|uniref:hypothetical protein n=1 Tax=Blattabacterium cuenoti TaxID=1653831 RepID=UPI00163CF770|nr:hypothetical protein [Blattabacterium cuenoti]
MKYFLKFHHYTAFLVLTFLVMLMIHLLWRKCYGLKVNEGTFFFKIILNGTVFTMIIQIFIGLLLINSYFFSLYKNNGMIQILKQEKNRFKFIEHPIMMMIGFLIFIFFYNKLYQKGKITNTILFLFFLSVLTIMIRFPFNN